MSNVYGRQVVLLLANKSGGGVIAGDVVVVDTTNNDAFTTSTAGAVTGGIGIAQETIASNATGRVLTAGYAALVNVNASVTRGNYGKTHTVAKQATSAGASRVTGAFCQFLTGGTTPDALVFGIADASTGASGSPSTPALTFSTTNSTGAAVTLVATDATIAIFDATTPSTQAFGDGGTVGVAAFAARRDHKHVMPANPVVVPWSIPGNNSQYHLGYASVGSSNRSIYQPCVIPVALTLTGVRIGIGVSSGNLCVGLYDSSNNRVATSGSVASPGTGQQSIAFTGNYAAAAGLYYLAFAANNTTLTFSCDATASLASPYMNPTYQETNFPLGTTRTSAGATSISINLVGTVSGGYP